MMTIMVPLIGADGDQVLAAPSFHRQATPSIPTLPSLRILPSYTCVPSVASEWSEAQKMYCCKNQHLGCETTTQTTTGRTATSSTSTRLATSERKVWSWGDEHETHETQSHDQRTSQLSSRRATSVSSTTSGIPTTTTNTCGSMCTINGVAASCRDQIQQASLSDFLGSVDSCSLAQRVTAEQCPVCGGCPPHEAGCGVLELVTTPAPTTTIPKGDACKAVCTLGGQPATCTARIMWSKDHVFADKPKACIQAHAMVLGQCSVCSLCTLKASSCEDPVPGSASEEIFDCTSGAAVEWSQAKAVWCCERHKRGCGVAPQDKRVFFQRKIAEDAAAAGAEQRLERRGRALAAGFIGLGALGSVILLFARSSSSGRRRCRRVRYADHLVLAE